MASLGASEVLAKYWDGSVPVDPVAIATRMGCAVYQDANLGCSSMVQGSSIFYSPGDSRLRQRFAVAHALGHIVLGHTELYPRLRDDHSSAAVDLIDIEANSFAAELLLPAEAVHRVVRSRAYRTISEMATLFDVTGSVMTYRLRVLEIIPA